MGLSHQHDLHRRRLSRNIGVGGLLFAFVAVVFALSFVKVTYQDPAQLTPRGTVQGAPDTLVETPAISATGAGQ